VKIKISFAGSFQCRLDTEHAPLDASPTEWTDTFPDTTGGTFSYNEEPFDRVVRLSNPQALRNALVDPWEDTKVTVVEVSPALALRMGPGTDEPVRGVAPDERLVPVRTDSLVGQVVSFGEAKLNAAEEAGAGGIGYEVFDDFAFSIGGMSFKAEQVGKTRMTGINPLPKAGAVRNGYKRKKKDGVKKALGTMHPARAKALSEYDISEPEDKGGCPRHIQGYAGYFAMQADMPDIPLTQVEVHGVGGVLSLTREANLVWKLSLNFSRFDGDTLTGKIKGVLEGSDSRG
jgi:hypothetical protein